MYLYLLPIVLVPLLLLAFAFFVIPTRSFELRSGNTYLANLGYGATLFHHDCQVLIYGDSSALVGLNPEVIRQQTGLTTCNIAEFEGVTLVSHMLLVDRFLQNNPPPRFLVFFYTPEDLSIPDDWESFNVGTFEAVTLQMQRNRSLGSSFLLAQHPSIAFAWAEQGLRMMLMQAHSAPVSPAAAMTRANTNGQLPMATDAIAKCDGNLRNRLPDPGWIGSLRQHYGTNATRVIVDATPTVDCDASLPFFQQHLNGLIDNGPYQPISISNYSADGRLHANQRGSQLLSTLVATQILNQLNPARKATIANGIGDR
jgi:hypothetical protein